MIEFGIKIATFYRDNHSTYDKITRTIESVKNQTYKNWKIILVGDGYEEKEFEKIKSLIPKEKLISANLDKRHEKDVLGLSGKDLWCCGGVEATNLGIELCKNNKINYYCSLDDDDVWFPFHLEMLNIGFTCFPESVFVYTNSLYTDRDNITKLFPPQQVLSLLQYNNLPPRAENLIHSTVSWKLDKIPIKYRNILEQNRTFPADADMWQRINSYCSQNNLKTLYIPITTVIKDCEAEILK